MDIGGTSVSSNSVYFIAEAGVNHNGDVEQGKKLVEAAAQAGADAVKFQTFSADRLVTEDSRKAEYQQESTDTDESQYEMLERLALSQANQQTIKAYCESHDITFLSTPFDPESANVLDQLDVAAFKIGSGELNNYPLLDHIASFGRPMIISTGMGTMDEVETAVKTIRESDQAVNLALLHCTSAYPTELADVNLRAMNRMADRFDVPVGYSDHTTTPETPAFAVAAGAVIVEKHFTLDSSLSGPDHAASLEPDELERAVKLARQAATTRGSSEKRPVAAELDNRRTARKSLHMEAAVEAGDQFTRENVAIKRPADGLPPKALSGVLGQKAATDLAKDTAITEDCVLGYELTQTASHRSGRPKR